MVLTKKQEEGLKLAIQRYKDGERYTVISGYAGVGKSTLVRFIIEALNLPENEVCYASFTGKAAEVLRKMGNKNAMTLHKLLYDSIPRIDGTFIRIPKKYLEYKLIIVDECSMMPTELANLLFSHKVHVICLGDPFQLPPIRKEDNNHLLDKPDIFLDEIMRQAAESEIIRVSMDIRANKPLSDFHGNEVMVLPRNELSTGMLQWADQILVATNNTRIEINNQMRQLLNRGQQPEAGDKVICLKNYWEIFGTDGNPLVNGTIGYIDNVFNSWVQLPRWLEGGRRLDVLIGDFISDSGELYKSMDMDKKMILTGEKCVNFSTEFKVNRNQKTRGIIPKEFTYGYAITTHKSQGSQWNNVLVIEESFPFSKEEHARWLYTSITRSIDKCVIIKN